MRKYNSNEFANALMTKCTGRTLRPCPFCGGQNFTTTDDFAAIAIGKDFSDLTFGPTIPAGIVICKNCGHMDFFALGALDLLPEKESENG